MTKKLIFLIKNRKVDTFRPFFRYKCLFFIHFLAFFILLAFTTVCQAQDEAKTFLDQLNLWIQDFVENQEDDANFEFNTLFENIVERTTNPLDLNKATFEDLQSLIIFSDAEINRIINHRITYGDFVDRYELQAIEGLSLEKARILSYLSYVDRNNFRNAPELAYSQLYTKWERKIQKEKAYRGDMPTYRGDQNYLYLRYLYRNSKTFNAGLTIEKDAGESFRDNTIGFDYIGAYLSKDHLTRHIQTLIIGDFTSSFGQGLILQNGYGFGKSSYTTTIKRNNRTIRPYSSANENIAFRGVATSVQFTNRLSSNILVSHSAIDGNLIVNDQDETESFSSFQISGFHRSSSELSDKNGVRKSAAAANVKYSDLTGNSLSINSIIQHYSAPLRRSDQLYNKFRFMGDQIINTSLDFSYFLHSINLFGEIAHSPNGALARTFSAITSIDPKFDIAINYRHFDTDYQAPSGLAFAEGTTVENEKGTYIGAEFRPNIRWRINAYADFWHHDWFKFGIDGPSNGNEYLIKLQHEIRKKRTTYLQYRYERKEENSDSDSRNSTLSNRFLHRLRLDHKEHINEHLEVRARAEISHYTKENITSSGLVIYQDFIYSSPTLPFSLSSRLAYFNAQDFDARIYAYERDLLYEFSIPFFYGRGWKYYGLMRYRFNQALLGELKWSHTIYTDGRITNGNGNSQTDGNHVSLIKAQIRYNF